MEEVCCWPQGRLDLPDVVIPQLRVLAGSDPAIVWNFPVDLTFQATNAFGWPKMHFSVYGLDFLGTDVVQGYGFTHIPCSAGRFELKVHLFKPKTRTGMTSLQSWILRRPAEFKQPDFVCQSEGREGLLLTCSNAYGIE